MTQRQIDKELNRQAVMFEELSEEWFEDYAKPHLRSTTYERMLRLRHRIYPAIGHLRIDKITVRQLQAFVNSLAKSAQTKRRAKPLLRKLSFTISALSRTFEWSLFPTIPAARWLSLRERSRKSRSIMELLLTRIMGEPVKYKAFFSLIAYSGFCRSEMLGLEWKDIDFENNIISVRRTSNYTAERGTYTDTTKTKRSQRTLKISPFIMDILRELKDEQDAEALRPGDKWVETDRLFTKWNGEEMNNQTPYGWLKEFFKNNELPFYGIHSFRHFAASSLISAGLDITTVSGALVHCYSGTTLNVYCHQFQTAQARYPPNNPTLDKANRLCGLNCRGA